MKILLLIIVSYLSSAQIMLGIDVLAESGFAGLEGKRVGILTNHAGRSVTGLSSIEILKNQDLFELSCVFVPEHGFYTSVPAGKHVENEQLFGVDVFSLYGKEKRPSKQMLDKCDILLIDIQDIGTRSYTFISAVFYVLDAAAEHGKKVVILDRPNPLGGQIVDGNVLELEFKSYVGMMPISYVHGMTIGELAKMINGESWLPAGVCDLDVIEMRGWNREMKWEETGLNWIPTSPHIPSINSVRGYPALGIIGELGIISIGIGTTLPFGYIGSPDFDTGKFIEALQKIGVGSKKGSGDYILEGVRLIKSKFRPFYGMYKGKDCNGFMLKYDDNFEPYSASVSILLALKNSHPEIFGEVTERSINMFKKVTGTDKIWNSVEANSPYIIENAKLGVDNFKKLREKYFLY